jgi:hypothetical protein
LFPKKLNYFKILNIKIMKHFTKITFTFALLFIVGKLLAQVGVSDLPSYSPNSKAMLDISSGNGVEKKGLLIPRMTSAQRVAITSPALGLMVFETTSNSFWYYNGTIWVNMGNGGGSLVLPYSATQADAGTLFSLSNSGAGRAGVFEINNATSTNHALFVSTNGLGRSSWFQSSNSANNAATLISENLGLGQAIYGTNFGTGKAGVFEINNGANNNCTSSYDKRNWKSWIFSNN